MFRIIIIFLLLSFSSDAVECDLSSFSKDTQGCFNIGVMFLMHKNKCTFEQRQCFTSPIIELEQEKIIKEEKKYSMPTKKEYFKDIKDKKDKEKIIEILNNSMTLLKMNTNLKDISIIFYDKTEKFNKDFEKEATQYLLDNGVKKDAFKIIVKKG